MQVVSQQLAKVGIRSTVDGAAGVELHDRRLRNGTRSWPTTWRPAGPSPSTDAPVVVLEELRRISVRGAVNWDVSRAPRRRAVEPYGSTTSSARSTRSSTNCRRSWSKSTVAGHPSWKSDWFQYNSESTPASSRQRTLRAAGLYTCRCWGVVVCT